MKGALRLAALALLVALAAAQPPLSDGLLKDREALLALKDAATNYGQSKMASWRPTGNPCFPKPWAHVTCAAARVTELNLANRKVVAVLPAKLRLAKDLVTLNLEGNLFTGNISDSWAGKNSFTKLRTLNLANNELSGTLPNWNRLGAWRSLENLDLSNNKFFGGLPANWLGKQRPLRNVRYMDLSNNKLGYSDAAGVTQLTTTTDWCKSETAAGLTAGSGWCPATAPYIVGTAASLVSLDLSNNGFKGPIPLQWPVIFSKLQYLSLQFNNLWSLQSTLPSGLPKDWSSAGRRVFQSLSMLTLYPGNDALCAIPDVEGGFLDVNRDATYQIADAQGVMYTNDNPRLCPTNGITDDNPVTSVAITEGTVVITKATDAANPIWGFKLTIYQQDTEGGEWTAVPNWNAVYLRTYTSGGDTFNADSVTAEGLTYAGSAWTLTFDATISDMRLRPLPDFTATTDVISAWKAEVVVVNLDGVESTPKSGTVANT